jgi:hypothetical protein
MPQMWVLLITLAVWFVFVLGFLAGRRIPSRQNLGEALVVEAIEGNLSRPYWLLNNVTLKTESGTTQIDHILVMDTGIFVIETKHYTGWIFGDPQGNQWTQTIFWKKSKFPNPVRQNYGHVQAIRSLFNLPAEAFLSLVVFTGDAEFKTNLGSTVLKLSQLNDYLSGERPVLFDKRQMTYIVGRIEMKRLRHSLETDEYHLNYIRQRIQAQNR